MVQSALLKALDKVDDFDALREGAFLAYLRKILLNNIRMEIRRIGRRNQHGVTDHDAEVIDGEASVLQRVIGADALDRYESALAELTPGAREAVILRVEFGYTFPEIAAATEANSANTARMLVTRSLVKVAEQMR